MPKLKRKRRPGAGRPPIDRQGSVIAQVRFTQDDWKAIEALASKHKGNASKSNVSKEIRAAVHYWLRLLEKPKMHVGALTCFIALLVRRIEARTGKKWLEDPATGVAVAKLTEQLIFHFAPTPAEPLTVSAELESIVGELITIAENLSPRPGVPEMRPELFGDEWAVLARIVKDMGSGWDRNKDGHLEKFLSPSRHESDSVTARGHGRMERAGHGAEGLFRC